jgi:hypothetical protein
MAPEAACAAIEGFPACTPDIAATELFRISLI